MNAIDLLIEDHERVKDLLTCLTDSTERAVKTRTELLSKLGNGSDHPYPAGRADSLSNA